MRDGGLKRWLGERTGTICWKKLNCHDGFSVIKYHNYVNFKRPSQILSILWKHIHQV